MIPEERRKKIFDYISKNHSVTINELSLEFAVSEMTVHRDLHILEAAGHIQKTHGGAVLSPYSVVTDFQLRALSNREEKEKIGKAASKLINSGDSIFMDASSTVQTIIPYIRNIQNITIFTSSISVPSKLAEMKNIEIYATGGLVYNGTDSFAGPTAIDFLKTIHVDKCFIGAAGICPPDGITDPILLLVELKRQIAKISNEVIVLVDKTKFGRMSKFNILPIEDIDVVITDADPESPCVVELSQLGANFIYAN